MPGAFKLDHLQYVKPILYLLTFILGTAIFLITSEGALRGDGKNIRKEESGKGNSEERLLNRPLRIA